MNNNTSEEINGNITRESGDNTISNVANSGSDVQGPIQQVQERSEEQQDNNMDTN